MPATEPRCAHGGNLKRRFETNLARKTYRAETLICYRLCCGGNLLGKVLTSAAHGLSSQRGVTTPSQQTTWSQPAVNYIAEHPTHRMFVGTI
jgi:hypothetical protein